MQKLLFIFFVTFLLMVAPLQVMAQPPVVGPVEVKIWTPDSSVKFAVADLETLPPETRIYTRYLSLYNIPAENRKKVAEIVSFVVNSLGTRRRIYIPAFVGASNETVIRINIKDYEWDRQVWDDLAKNGSGPKPYPEPYFHEFGQDIDAAVEKIEEELIDDKIRIGNKIEVIAECDALKAGTSQTLCNLPVGRQYEVIKIENGFFLIETKYGRGWALEKYFKKVQFEKQKNSTKKEYKKYASARWLTYTAISKLISESQSESPILRADWFIINATLAPIYYDFLKLGKKYKDFEKLVFTDEDLARKAKSQFKAVVIQSIVARHNRTLTRSPTFTNGYAWRSHDSLKSTGDRKYIQNFLHELFDATEDIGTLPNGLQAYFLTDGKENRLDFANPDIAIDNTAVDRIVRNGRSCMICHAEGIKPIEDELRVLNKKLQNMESIKLLAVNEEDAYRIEDLFGTDLDKQIIKDQNIYAEAIANVNGLTPAVNAKQYAAIYDNYAERLLTKEEVAKEVGVPINELEKYIKMSDDPVILGLIKNPIRPVRRDQFEESFKKFMLIILSSKMANN